MSGEAGVVVDRSAGRWLGTGSAARALLVRELVRLSRQPARVMATLGIGVIVWVFLGSGFSGSFAGSVDYSAFVLPGVVGMVVMFSAVFSALSLIEDRDAGYLRSVLVSPASIDAVILSKVGAGGAVAALQALVLLPAAWMVGLEPGVAGIGLALVAMVLMAVGVAGVGLALAWRTRSVAGYHGVMNMVLMPAWLLSGALFPLEEATGWLGAIGAVNPLAWVTTAMRGALTGDAVGAGVWIGSVAFAGGGVAAAWWAMRRGA